MSFRPLAGPSAKFAIVAGLLLGSASGLSAQVVLKFDDLIPFSQPAQQYAGLGVHFTTTDAGLQNGIANGDSGTWLLNGTNGPYFLGFNGGTYAETISFDSAIGTLSMDVSRSNGSSAGDTFLLQAFAG